MVSASHNDNDSEEVREAALRIVIADDHPLYRDALELVVGDIFPAAGIITCASQDDVLGVIRQDDGADLVLLDLKLPGAMGFTCLTLIHDLNPITPVVIVSAIEDPATMREAIEHGASGYLPKSSDRKTMRHALQLVMAGSVFLPVSAVSSNWLRRPAQPQKESADGEQTSLTARQRIVLKLMAEGKSNKEIANELSITEITVKAHVSAILRKLGVSNRVQAAMLAKDVLLPGNESGVID